MRCAAWLHALDSKDQQSKDYTLKVYNVGSACKTMMQQNQYDHWINVQRSSWCFIQFHKIKRVLFIGKIQSCVSLFSRNVFFWLFFFAMMRAGLSTVSEIYIETIMNLIIIWRPMVIDILVYQPREKNDRTMEKRNPYEKRSRIIH